MKVRASSKQFLFFLFVFAFFTCGFSRKIFTVNHVEPAFNDAQKGDNNQNMMEITSKSDKNDDGHVSELDLEVGDKTRPTNSDVHAYKSLNLSSRPERKQRRKSRKRSKSLEKGSPWFHCSDDSTPQEVTTRSHHRGVMCNREYPSHSCCAEHDLTVDLLGSKVADQISDNPCVHLLKKLRCAHCSPRSWWLFHAADKRRHPHKRVVPILCPSFCKKFHSACRDSISGLQNDDFCEFHTSKDAGPCFPDYKIRRGTID